MNNLRKTTFLTIFSVTIIFILKFIGTASPNFFSNPDLAVLFSIITIIASFIVILFFVFFYFDFVEFHQTGLRFSTKLMLISSSLMSLLYIYKFAGFFYDIHSLRMYYFDILSLMIPVVYSVSMLIFFIFFFIEALPGDLIKLRRSTTIVITATSFISVLKLIQFFSFIHFERTQNVQTMIDISIIGVPFILLEFGALVNFFKIFYKLLKQDYWY
ncbi:MAG: hypothetical protein U9N34_00555 [Candidatus Cloacimonadota bacterium]|nr:hypothetical protein [Candidatus Cloacimonadota bacterium]